MFVIFFNILNQILFKFIFLILPPLNKNSGKIMFKHAWTFYKISTTTFQSNLISTSKITINLAKEEEISTWV
jgi:hypothetical protein